MYAVLDKACTVNIRGLELGGGKDFPMANVSNWLTLSSLKT
jgi:hypothetical protein